MKNGIVILALLGCLQAGAAVPAGAAEEAVPAPEVRSLGGIRAFGIIVAPVDSEMEKEGVTSLSLREDVRSFLNRRGLVVLKAGESYTFPGSPNLFLRVRARRTADGKAQAVAVSLQFLQDVALRRNRQDAYASTWDEVDAVPSDDPGAIREAVEGLLERFLEAYAASRSDRRGK